MLSLLSRATILLLLTSFAGLHLPAGAVPLPKEVIELFKNSPGDSFPNADPVKDKRLKQKAFKVELHPELQRLVDRLTEKMLSSKVARKKLAPLINDASAIARVFGTSESAAVRIQRKFGKPSRSNRVNLFSDAMFSNSGLLERRLFTFILMEKSIDLDAYSLGDGQTLIFLNPQHLSEDRLFATIIHEGAVNLDRRTYSIYQSQKEKWENFEWVWNFIQTSTLDDGLKSVKAYRLEEQILAEFPEYSMALAGFKSSSPSTLEGCVQYVASSVRSLYKVSELKIPRQVQQLLKELQLNGRCLEISEFELETRAIGFRRGPRPRLGGD